MRRMVLILRTLTLVAAMVCTTALSGVAKEYSLSEDIPPPPPLEEDGTTPFEDIPLPPPLEEDSSTPSEDVSPPFEDIPPPYEDTAPAENASKQETALCAPQWQQEWYPDWVSGWRWFWWFQYCYTDAQGWYRVYDGWDWGMPM